MTPPHRPRVLIVPDWREGNPYLDLLATALGQHGIDVVFDDFPANRFPFRSLLERHPSIDVVHVHWVAELLRPILRVPPLRRFVRLNALTADLRLLRARGLRIVWTIHNLVGHESPDPELETRIRRRLARLCDRIIVHSPGALAQIETEYGGRIARRTCVIPHGNYIGAYPASQGRRAALMSELGLDGNETTVLYFGRMRGYKGVEDLVRSFRDTTRADLRLVVAGQCPDTDLERELRAHAESDSRIRLRLGVVPNSEVAALLETADVVALPFERILTSGSAVLAMSVGKALIMPEHARALDLGGDSGTLFYASEEQLSGRLEDLDRETLAEMGTAGLELAREWDWDGIGAQTLGVYGV